MGMAGKNIKACVTCAYYNGNRSPSCGTFVDFDSSEKGKCYRTFRQGIDKNPLDSCSNWEIWSPINK